jgi:Fe-S cluster assembly protein SufD
LPELHDVTALLEQFGIGDAQAREESWRYSRSALRALEQQDFAAGSASAVVAQTLVERFDWPQTQSCRVVFVNGVCSQTLSSLDSAADFDIAHGEGVTTIRCLGSELSRLHLVFVGVPGAKAVRWDRELRVEVSNARTQVIEQHLADGGADSLGALTSQMSVASGARLHLIRLVDLPDTASLYRRDRVQVESGGVYESTLALFGSRLQRHDMRFDLAGDGARCGQRGVFALRGREHCDVHLDVFHAARNTTSDVLWRGVADQRARGILRGAITVAAGADGADAQLQTRNLLLSPHAEIDAQPVLEIHADEVKASHGATVGELDERALFYLRSRGIAAVDARSMLIGGFCREAFAALDDAGIHAQLDAALSRHLPHARVP